MELIGIRVDEKTKDTLEQLAKKDGRSLSNYCRVVLESHITVRDFVSEDPIRATPEIFEEIDMMVNRLKEMAELVKTRRDPEKAEKGPRSKPGTPKDKT